MITRLDLGSIRVDVVRKNIKNIHLGVYPPTGKVRIAAPEWMELDAIRLFVINKLGWIRQQQKKLLAQERETPREYLERESTSFDPSDAQTSAVAGSPRHRREETRGAAG